MQLHVAADTLPDESAAKPRLEKILKLMAQVIEEGRHAVQGLRSQRSESHDLDQAFSRIQQEMGIQEDVKFRVIVQGGRSRCTQSCGMRSTASAGKLS